MIAPLAASAMLAALAGVPAFATPSGENVGIAHGQRQEDGAVGQARGLHRRRLRDVRRHDAGVGSEGAHGDALRPSAEAAAAGAAAGPRCAASRASASGTAPTPASPASSCASASAGFSPVTPTAPSSASAGATRAARSFAPPSESPPAASFPTSVPTCSCATPDVVRANGGEELDLPRGRRQHRQRPGRRVRGHARIRSVRRRLQPDDPVAGRRRRRSSRSRRRAASPETASHSRPTTAALIAESREDNNVLARRCAVR